MGQRDLLLENLKLVDVNPLVCGIQTCEPGYRFGPAIRSYHLLHYVHSGMGTLHNERGSRLVKADQIFVIRPGESTVYIADERRPWSYSWVGFESPLPLDDILAADVFDAAHCGGLFAEMVNCPSGAGLEWFICGKIYQLLYLLARPNIESGVQHYIRRTLDFIESNYMKELTISGIAQSLGLDRSYLTRIFKAHTGKAPQAYLVEFRLQKAAELLSAQDMTLGQIAVQVGYHDTMNFSRMFRRQFGMPPGMYRRLAMQRQGTQQKEEQLHVDKGASIHFPMKEEAVRI